MMKMMDLIKKAGQPFCILLYVVSIIMAFRKKLVPLIILFTMHLSEFVIIGKKVGEEHGLSKLSALTHCLAFGFTWWLPLKKSDDE